MNVLDLFSPPLAVYHYFFPPSTNPYDPNSLDFVGLLADNAKNLVTNPSEQISTVMYQVWNLFYDFVFYVIEISIWASLELFYLTVVASLKVAFQILESFGVFDALANAINMLDFKTISVIHYLTVDKLAMYCMVAMLSRFILRIVWK